MPKPRPSPSSTHRPSFLSRHSSLSYSPDSCEVTPLIRGSSLSEDEARRAYRRGKFVGLFLALGFLIVMGVLLVVFDVFVLKVGRGGDGDERGDGMSVTLQNSGKSMAGESCIAVVLLNFSFWLHAVLVIFLTRLLYHFVDFQ
ncbi:hypothetical protein ONS95_010729 [Cadophora gregata]|uniref:uncharacterized protein n=1 Tax=Cadophora gregata TaxID=51156 RepID=UPI0026DCBD65|nr:uncharacterized protein ONS95_010729 [Cadophora gregata]KAK0122499.1 hypothetical protein ONS95_010729 [Cadophora gregata]